MGRLCDKKRNVFCQIFGYNFISRQEREKEGQKKGEEGGRGGGMKPERDRRETRYKRRPNKGWSPPRVGDSGQY